MSPGLPRWIFTACLLAFSLLLAPSCAPVKPQNDAPLQRQADGSFVWRQEYRFSPPPAPWELIDLNEDDYSVAYMKMCGGDLHPCQSTLAYAEEPFGYSLDFQKRQSEFFERFLWASRAKFEPAQTRKVQVLGKEGLEAVTIGREPVLGHKVRAKIFFARRGERVVAFYYSQWRPEEAEFDLADEEDFERFVQSFGFVRPSFYEQLLTD